MQDQHHLQRSLTMTTQAESIDGSLRDRYEQLALRVVQHGIVITDCLAPDDPIVYCNDEFLRITGFTRDEVLGRNCRFLQGHDTASAAIGQMALAKKNGAGCTVTVKNYRKDGSTFWNQVQIRPIFDDSGQITHCVGIQTDVSEQHRANERARQLSLILERSLNEIYIFDARTLQFLLVNRGARTNMGYSMAEFATLTPVDIKPQFSREEFFELIAPLHQGEQELLVFETVHERRDKTQYPVEVHLQRISFESNPAYVAIILDTTARMQAQSELRDSYDELSALSTQLITIRDQERQRLARDIHDDLGQILAAAKMDLSSLKHGAPEAVTKISDQLASIDALLTDAVTSTRRIIQDLRPEALDSVGLLGALEMLVTEFGKRHNLPTEFVADCDPTSIDEGLITPIFRLVQESLNNVAKHAQASRVTINLRRESDRLFVAVSDNGIGFDPAKLHASTGFGISGMQERVQMLNGQFSVSSDARCGTTITAELPIAHNTSRPVKRR